MRAANSISSCGVRSFTCPISRRYNLMAVSPSYEERSRSGAAGVISTFAGAGAGSMEREAPSLAGEETGAGEDADEGLRAVRDFERFAARAGLFTGFCLTAISAE